MSAIYVHWCRNKSDYAIFSVVSGKRHNKNLVENIHGTIEISVRTDMNYVLVIYFIFAC